MRSSSLRRYKENNNSGSGLQQSYVGPISTTLIKQVTETTDTSSSAGLQLTMGQHVSIAHHAFDFVKNGKKRFWVPADGGRLTSKEMETRVYNTSGGDYARLASDVSPFIQIPNAGTGGGSSGPKVWGGLGLPTATTSPAGSRVGTATAGDYYFRVRSVSSTPVLYVCTVGGSPGTWVQVI